MAININTAIKLFLILTGVLLVYISCSNSSDVDISSQILTENQQIKRKQITALGRLEPESEILYLSVPVPGLLGELLVKESETVESGQLLAKMDSYHQRFAEHDIASILLEESKKRLDSEIALARTQIKEAEIQIEQLTTVLPLEIQTQKADIERLNAQLDDASENLRRLKNLAARKSVTDQDLDSQVSIVKQIEAQIKRAQSALDQTEKSRQVELSLAHAKLDSSRALLKRAQNSSNLRSLEQQLRLAEINLDKTLIRSPITGEILKINIRPGESTETGPILQLADTRQMYVVAEVFESDIKLIQPGCKAEAISTSLDFPLIGVVERIRPIVLKNQLLDLDPSAEIDRRVVEVRIRLEDSKEARKLINLQVDVQIETISNSLS